MKKDLKKIIAFTMIFIFIFQSSIFALTSNMIVIGDKLLPSDETTIYENYSNYISKEILKSELGFKIWENKQTSTVYIKKDDNLLAITGQNALLNWKMVKISNYPKKINGALCIPVSILSAIFKITVAYNNEYRFVWLNTSEQSVVDSVYTSVYDSTVTDSVYNSVYSYNRLIDRYHDEFIDFVKNQNINIDGVCPPKNPKKFAYLTFDDGPNPKVTPVILDTLKKYNVKATFFMLGMYVKQYPELVKKVYDDGHYIGNHSYSHKIEIFYSINKFKDEIEKTSNLIFNVTGQHPKLFRPPYGNKMGTPFKKFLKDSSYKVYLWNDESGDSHGHNVPSETIIKNVGNYLSGSKDIVIIMHDGIGHIQTAYSLKSIIKELWKNGYGIKALTPETLVNARVEM